MDCGSSVGSPSSAAAGATATSGARSSDAPAKLTAPRRRTADLRNELTFAPSPAVIGRFRRHVATMPPCGRQTTLWHKNPFPGLESARSCQRTPTASSAATPPATRRAPRFIAEGPVLVPIWSIDRRQQLLRFGKQIVACLLAQSVRPLGVLQVRSEEHTSELQSLGHLV